MSTRPVLYEKVFDHLSEEIRSGRYKPGDMIPTEKELMAQFSVSRMTTNRALQMLAAAGAITRKAGLGTFVSAVEPEANASLTHDSAPSLALATKAPDAPTSVIGFVIPFIDQTIGPKLLSEIEKQLHHVGLCLSLACSYGSQEIEEAVIEQQLAIGAQGLIVFPVNGEFYNPAILRLHVRHFPIVLVDKQLQGIPLPYVVSDNIGGARLLVDHLLEMGHTNIAFYSPPCDGTSSLSDRLTGYQQALETSGIAFTSEYVVTTEKPCDNQLECEAIQVKAIEDFLSEHRHVTAVFASDDHLAQLWMVALRRLHLRVPRDFSIVCFDSPPSSSISWSLTCAMQDQVQMARNAVQMIVDLLTGDSSDNMLGVTLPAEFSLGSSSGPVPTDMAFRSSRRCLDTAAR